MDYRIEKQPAFKIVGKEIRVRTKDGENQRLIPQFWSECFQDGTCDRLGALSTGGGLLGNVMLGVCTDFAPDMSEFTYMIAAESPDGSVPDGMVERTVAAATWAAFESVGAMPEAIQAVWGRIWSEFLPSSPYKHCDGPELELYPPGDSTQPDYRCEVRIPVALKE